MIIVTASDAPSGVPIVRLNSETETAIWTTTDEGQCLNYGIGEKEVDRDRFSQICRGVVIEVQRQKISEIVLDFQDFLDISADTESPAYVLGIDLQLASYQSGKYKTTKGGYGGLESVTVINADDYANLLFAGSEVGLGTNQCRELVDEPSNLLDPMGLYERAQVLAYETPAKVTVLGYEHLKSEGYGLLCAVGQGAANPPCLIEVSYMGGGEKVPPVVIVGKGITLDTGGTDLKLSGAIQGMQKDMGGGAAAIMAVIIAARLKLPVNVIAVVPAAENLVSSTCYRTCDVRTGLDGRTVEVRNTDAEGRLVLSDGIVHAIRTYDPSLLVTVATLTGAVRIALGSLHTGLFSSDEDFAGLMTAWGVESGNPVCLLPHKGYESYLESSVADIANVQAGGGKDGGACVAAAFLAQAAKPLRGIFAHLDIAGTAMEGSGKDGLLKGAATGTPVPLLVRMLEGFVLDV